MANYLGNKVGVGLAIAGVVGIAAVAGWMLATLGGGGAKVVPIEKEVVEAKADPKVKAAPHPLEHLFGKDPVAYYRGGKSAKERMDAISNFMALGDDNNYAMLKAALDDADKEIRMFAVESATSLEVAHAVDVWKKSATSPDPDVREMTWSLSATYPMESRAAICREALTKGPNEAVTEAINEMTVTPERPLFEMMLTMGDALPADRAPEVLKAIQEWLVPGGGEVPVFKSIPEAVKFWEAQHQNYDEYMLRVDQ
jgi:hypothetical protein